MQIETENHNQGSKTLNHLCTTKITNSCYHNNSWFCPYE